MTNQKQKTNDNRPNKTHNTTTWTQNNKPQTNSKTKQPHNTT